MNIEKKLANIFDYQKFEHNDKLDSLIQDAEKAGLDAFSLPDEFLQNVAGGVDSPSQYTQYTTKDGDTVATISARFGVGVEDICRVNGFTQAQPLPPEMLLLIPYKG